MVNLDYMGEDMQYLKTFKAWRLSFKGKAALTLQFFILFLGLFGGGTTCTGGRQSDDCFTTRFQWRSEGRGEVYAYVPGEQVNQTFYWKSISML